MMKSILLFAFAILSMVSCNSQNRTSDMQVISSDDSSLTLNINNSKPEYDAIYHLLFRGFPNSNQTTALISTSEDEIQKMHPEYFKTLFSGNRYKTFITSSSKNTNGSQRVVLNTRALKSDLEQNSIIRKFGY